MGQQSAEIIPNGNWKEAKDATVKVESNIFENIPIIQLRYTTAILTVRKDNPHYKDHDGVIFLNEKPLPENDSPISLPLEIAKSSPIERVKIERDKEWNHDNGVVVLFDRDIPGKGYSKQA